MAVKPSSPASDLADLVTCSICLENFEDARALPCLHSYCKKCLHGLLSPEGKITCPHCRLEHHIPNGDVSNLKPNFFVNTVLDVLDSEANGIPADTVAAADDDAPPSNEKVNATCCKDHPEKECELFCQDCSKLICYKCVSNWGTCGKHSYESIDTVVKEYQEKLENYLHKKEELLPSVIKHIAVLAEMKGKQSDIFSNITKTISDTFAKHMESLKMREATLIQQAWEMQLGNADCLTDELDKVNLELAKTETTIDFCHKILKLQDPVLVLKTYSDLKEKVSEADSQELVSHVDIKALCFQATDTLLSDVISNFGNVVHGEVGAAEEKPPEAVIHKRLPTADRPANEPRFSNKPGPSDKPVPVNKPVGQPIQPGASTKPETWRLHKKYLSASDITFEDDGYSVRTRSRKNAAIVGKPGYRRGKHSWKIKVTGFSDGLSIGICVGGNGPGIVVTYDSSLTFGSAVNVLVELDCDARTVSVLPDGHQSPNVLGFDNPRNLEVHPYFNLPPTVLFPPPNHHKITIVNIDGVALEYDESCTIL